MSTLYRKYRPQRWADIAGQEAIKATLAQEVASGQLAHAYLFAGPRGVGKTTAARILARAVNCERAAGTGAGEPCDECASCLLSVDGRTLDIIEIDAASNRGIDAVRENIIENSRFAPSRLARKVFIIDEVHMLTPEAWAALLKTLEEPPERVIFVLATTELHKVPATILSRCQRFDFRRIPFAAAVERLERLAEREGAKVDRRAIEEVARLADGGLRDAESLLGKVLSVADGGRVTYDSALAVLPRSDRGTIVQFTEALLTGDGRTAIALLGDCLEQGTDLEHFADDTTEMLRRVLLVQVGGAAEAASADVDPDAAKAVAALAQKIDGRRVIQALELMLEKRRDLKSAMPAQLPLELVVARMCVAAPTQPETVVTAPSSASRPAEAAAPPAPVPAQEKAEIREPAKAVVAPVAVEVRGTAIIDVREIKARWLEIMKQIGERSASLTFVLGTAEPTEVIGSTIRIGLRFPFHRDKLNEAKHRNIIGETISEVIGQKVDIEPVLLEISAAPEHTDGAMAIVDPLAAAFGGRVVE
jgi:DNA polymerase-3 subunit gamma/tau